MLVKLEKATDIEEFSCPKDDIRENIGYCRKIDCEFFNGYKTMEDDSRNILCDYNK